MPRPTRPSLPAFLAASMLLAAATSASADRLVAGGATLSGEVKTVTPAGVEFQPGFAKDPMLVPWDNVEDLSTEKSYQFLHGDDQEVDAPITAFKDGKLQVGDASIAPDSLVTVVALADGAPGWGDRMRASWRYWSGGIDLAFNLQQATNDNRGLMIGFHTLRSQGPTRLMFGANYRFANQNPDDGPEENVQDSASGSLRGEYDITKRLYAYGSTDVLYDAVQDLNLRAVPKAGLGFTVWQREPKEGVRDFLQVEAGAGWVYENYMDFKVPGDPEGEDASVAACDLSENKYDEDSDRCVGDKSDYFTVAFGASAAVLLPRGAAFDWRFDYLPSVSGFTEDYVIRTQAGLSIPLIDPLTARLAIVDTYDSSPSPDAKKNSLVFDTGLSVGW